MLEMLTLRAKLMASFLMDKKSFKIKTYSGKRNVFIFLGADYGNLGDVAITLAQIQYLKSLCSEFNVVEIPISKTFAGIKAVNRIIGKDDIVTLIGGGNTSDLYDDIEFFRQLVVFYFRHYKIIEFPQTFSFRNTPKGRLCRFFAHWIYSIADDLTLLARERNTLNILQSYFSNIRSFLIPDIVMTLDERKNSIRRGALVCMRSDKEQIVSSDIQNRVVERIKAKLGSISYQDTQVANVNENNRFECLSQLLDQFRSHELVLTDRLHGMIFCFITGTPALILDNSTHKVSACYEWIKDCGYIRMLESAEDVDRFTPVFNFECTHEKILDRFNCFLCPEFLS